MRLTGRGGAGRSAMELQTRIRSRRSSGANRKIVAWKSPVPVAGTAPPTVVGHRVFLATADEQEGIQSVLCYDRRDWQATLANGSASWRLDAKER